MQETPDIPPRRPGEALFMQAMELAYPEMLGPDAPNDLAIWIKVQAWRRFLRRFFEMHDVRFDAAQQARFTQLMKGSDDLALEAFFQEAIPDYEAKLLKTGFAIRITGV